MYVAKPPCGPDSSFRATPLPTCKGLTLGTEQRGPGRAGPRPGLRRRPLTRHPPAPAGEEGRPRQRLQGDSLAHQVHLAT